MTKRAASLEAVLCYRNPDVVDRYVKDFGGARREAELVFRALLKWLYLASRSGPVSCFITSDLGKIDDMWHTFILFTPAYTAFCGEQFGRYLHHQPLTGREAKISATEERRRHRRYYELVYDILGEETFREWFFSDRFKRNRGPWDASRSPKHRRGTA